MLTCLISAITMKLTYMFTKNKKTGYNNAKKTLRWKKYSGNYLVLPKEKNGVKSIFSTGESIYN